MAAENCESCGENPATIRCIEVVGGEKRSRMFCEACLAEKGVVIDPGAIKKAATQFIEELTEQELSGDQPRPGSRCLGCGLTWAEFKNFNRLGCAACYQTFETEVEGMLDRIHGGIRHAGRVPEEASGRLEQRRKHTEIRTELDDAIRAEDYERAARLRDALQTIDRGEDVNGGAS